jgi:hypothetical protein
LLLAKAAPSLVGEVLDGRIAGHLPAPEHRSLQVWSTFASRIDVGAPDRLHYEVDVCRSMGPEAHLDLIRLLGGVDH